MSAAAAYHSVQAFLPENPIRSWFTSPRSQLWFRPAPERYGTLAPLPGDGAEPFARVAEGASRVGLDLVAWLVLTHSSLAAANADLAVRPLGGEPLPGALCPAQPAVHEYVVALAADVDGRFAPAALDLETPGWVSVPHHAHAKVGVPLGEAARFAAGVCVCDACARLGGRDAAARLRELVHAGRAATLTLDELLAEDAEIAAFQRARERVVRELVSAVATAVRARVHVLHWGDARTSGVDLGSLEAADQVTLLAYTPDPEVVARTLAPVVAACGRERVAAGLSLCHPEAPDASTFRACAERARALGVESVSLYNHSLVPRERLAWL